MSNTLLQLERREKELRARSEHLVARNKACEVKAIPRG